MSQVSLVSSGSAVVTTSEIDGQSVVVPTSGANDYSSIINYLAKQLSSNPAVSENATISIYNASSVAGKAASEKTCSRVKAIILVELVMLRIAMLTVALLIRYMI